MKRKSIFIYLSFDNVRSTGSIFLLSIGIILLQLGELEPSVDSC